MKEATSRRTRRTSAGVKRQRTSDDEAPYHIYDTNRTLIDNLPVGVYRNTPGVKGRFLEANPAIVAMFDAKDVAELLRYNVSDFYADPRKRKAFAAELMKRGTVQNEELELVTLKGRKIIGSVTATMGRAPDGSMYFDGIIEDITERRKTETALREAETQQRLEQTLDSMIEGCQVISPDFRYLYVNQAVAEQGHKTKKQLLGNTMAEVYPGIERTEMFKRLKRCMKSRELQQMENEFRFPDGSTVWFELKIEPVPQGVLIFSEDISERKNAVEALAARNKKLEALTKSQERTREKLQVTLDELRHAKDEINLEKITDQAILENIGEGLIATNAQARIMVINQAALKLLGRKAAELRGQSITKLPMFDSEGRRITAARRPIYLALEAAATAGPSFSGYYFEHKTRGKFPIGLTVTPIRLAGKTIGAIEIFRDISKEQEIDKAKTEFVSIASHQLRTPLGLAKWYLEAIRDEGMDELSTTAKSYFDEIYKSNERVLKVVRELLSVSRIDQRRVKYDPKRTDVAHMVRNIVQEMSQVAAQKNITLSLKFNRAQLPTIYADQLRLHEVVQNLIANALEYTPDGGKVVVTVEKKPRAIAIRVADSGIGITEADQKRLFSKFFRAESAALRNPDGSGLGLYVVKSYVEAWGGKISVSSQEGKGATFTITLPLKGAANHEKNTDN